MSQSYHHGALREAMIAAAETILERDGIAALTLRAAAREAGVSHGAPAHHFGNLSGLLSELAASGFLRLRQHLLDGIESAGTQSTQHMAGLSRGYVAFARSAPGLFRLMFRSEQLDWSNPILSAAGGAAFAMLLPQASADEADRMTLSRVGSAMAHWSMVHGLATLLIDGRLNAVAKELSLEVSVEALVEEILRNGVAHLR